MYIQEEDIVYQAKINGSEDLLPILIKRLVYASLVDGGSVRFKTGKAGRTKGWDGVVQANSSSLNVEEGFSIWELSNQKEGLASKFDKDLNRIIQNTTVIPRNTTLVFVTMQRWAKHEDWSANHRNKGEWKNIYVLSASEIAGWINQCPGVLAWVRFKFNLSPMYVFGLEERLHDLLSRGQRIQDSRALLVERDGEVAKLKSWLKNEPAFLTIKTVDEDEAIAFLGSVVDSLSSDESEAIQSRTVIVRNQDDYEYLKRKYSSRQSRNLIIVVSFEGFDLSLTGVNRGHHILYVSCNQDENVVGNGIIELKAKRLIPPGARAELQRYLESTPSNQNVRKAVDSALLNKLIPLLFLGGWSKDDRNETKILEKLSQNIITDDLEKELIINLNGEDPLVYRKNKRWFIRNPKNLWEEASKIISSAEIESFKVVSKEVLLDLDGQYDLPQDERWLAGLKGKGTQYSDETKEGVSTALIFIVLYHERITYFESQNVSNFVSDIIRTVLEKDWKIWASLSGVLPLLAEADPETFLEMTAESIGNAEGVLKLFEGGNDSYFSRTPHTGLLFSLELLAWNKHYLNRVVECILKLESVESRLPDNLVNRPSNSLRQIFLSWMPQTEARAEERIKVLNYYKNKYPKEVFNLSLSLMPKGHESGRYNPRPRYRWIYPEQSEITVDDFNTFIDGVENIIRHFIFNNVVNLQKALLQYTRFTADMRGFILDQLSYLPSIEIPEDAQIYINLIWNQVRGIVHSQFCFEGSHMTLELPEIDELMVYYNALKPENLIESCIWLFGREIKLLSGERDDWRRYGELVRAQQCASIRLLFKNGAEKSIEELVSQCERPELVAQSVYHEGIELDLAMIKKWNWDHKKNKDFLKQYWMLSTYDIDTRKELDKFLIRITDLNESQKDLVYVSLPDKEIVRDFIQSLDERVRKKYWESIQFWSLNKWDEDEKRKVMELVNVNRVCDAVTLLASAIEYFKKPEEYVFSLLNSFLKRFSPDDFDRFWKNDLNYEVGNLLKYLEEEFLDRQDEIAYLEFQLLPLLNERYFDFKALYSFLGSSPKEYAQLVINAYKAQNEDPPNLGEGENGLARVSYNLLKNWNHFPGLDNNNNLSCEGLEEWIRVVRDELRKSDRVEIGETKIGEVLSRSPIGNDSVWPHECVRKVLESSSNKALSSGFEIAVLNSRGIVSRSPGEGGQQERTLVEKYDAWYGELVLEYPKTARILKSISEYYHLEAKREDLEAEEYS